MIITLYGPNKYLLEKRQKELMTGFSTKYGSDSIVQTDAGEDIIDLAATGSLFAEKRMIVITNFLGNKKNEKHFDAVLEFLKKGLGENVALFVEKADFDKRKKLAKFLTKPTAKSGVNIKSEEFPLMHGFKLQKWIQEMVAKNGAQIADNAAELLTVLIADDSIRLMQEVDKLCLYVGSGMITREIVAEMVHGVITMKIFDMLDAFAVGDRKKAYLLHEHLLEQGESREYLYSMLVYQVRNMLLIRGMLDTGLREAEIAKQASLHPFVVSKTMAICQKMSLGSLYDMHTSLLQIDVAVKFGKGMIADLLPQFFWAKKQGV